MMANRSLRKLIFGLRLNFVVLAAIGSVVIGLTSWSAYHDYLVVEAERPIDDRMQQAAARMLDLEQRMTASVRTAVRTGDPKSEEEFWRTQPLLAQTIAEAGRLLPEATHRSVAKIKAANDASVALENEAIKLARQGQAGPARQLIASDGLAAEHARYTQGLEEFNKLVVGAQDVFYAHRIDSIRVEAFLTLTSLALMVLGAVLALRTARRWQAVVIGKNRRLQQTGDELAALNQHLDQTVSERTQALTQRTVELAKIAKRLEDSEAQYRLLFENNPHPMWVYDLESLRFLAVNASAAEHYGYSIDEFLSMTLRDIRPPEDVAMLEQDVRTKRQDGKNIGMWRHRKKDGSLIDVEISSDRVTFNGVRARLILAHDVTVRNLAELQLRRLNRVYKVLSQINCLIVRVQSRDELFWEACRIAVEAGEFVAASISLVDSLTRKLLQVASHASDGARAWPLPEGLVRDEAVEDAARSAVLFERREPLVCNDVGREPDRCFESQASIPGVRAVVTMPLVLEDQTIGLFELFSGDPDVFDDAEMKLLLELAGDIAFALSTLDKAEQLDYLAYFDQLTGLPNRKLFAERIGQKLAMVSKELPQVAVAYIEVDDLARIHQSLGRNVGDTLVRKLASRFTETFASVGTIARLSDHAFGVALHGYWDAIAVARAEESFHAPLFAAPIIFAGREFQLDGKTGLSFSPTDGNDPDTLIAHAEAALHEAKASDERIVFYDARMGARVAETLSLETRLRRAVERGEFVLHYQQKVASTTRRIVAVEALMRWNDPETGLVPPFKFIPILEETGLIVPVGAWALRQAARDHARWLELGLDAPRIAVNVSVVQLRKKDFVEVVERSVAGDARSGGVDIEITESVVMRDPDDCMRKLGAIRELGMGISMDDFGTGYSSLASLAKLPITEVKIDRSFVNTMITEPTAMSLVSTIISMAHTLELKVVAEGVELEDQARYLGLLRCDELQGYLFGKPVPFEAMTAMIEQESRTPSESLAGPRTQSGRK
jgi:PAS domain S-box-containing protein/diguanylate cyclase (GGDEF)-like protein